MRFGEQHRAGDALRLELEEAVADDRQARRCGAARRTARAAASACVQLRRVARGSRTTRPSRWMPSIDVPSRRSRSRLTSPQTCASCRRCVTARSNSVLLICARNDSVAWRDDISVPLLPPVLLPRVSACARRNTEIIAQCSHFRHNFQFPRACGTLPARHPPILDARRHRHRPAPQQRATDYELANAIRALAMDAVEAAKSGHPGMPMGMAEIAVALWTRHLRHNPANPHWPDRDRFVLSNGHGSMLQYALLHLTGYDLPMDELRSFRQLQLEDARASGGRRHARRRDDHRPARPGPRQRGRHGARREAARRAVQPARATRSSTTAPTCSWATAA